MSLVGKNKDIKILTATAATIAGEHELPSQ